MRQESHQELFANGGIESYTKRKRADVTDAAREIPLDELDGTDAVDQVADAGRLRQIELDRRSADFVPEESDAGVGITLVVNYVGDSALFRFRPTTDSGLSRVTGSAGGHPADAFRGQVRVFEAFPMGTPKEQIEAWGKAQADLLERWTDHMNVDVREHNQHMEALAAALVRARRERVADADRLRGELGKGI